MHSVTFDRIADRYDETRGGLARGRWLAEVISPRLRDGTVVEVGVGTGIIALPLSELGHPVVGVDLSARMLARARERVGVLVRADGYRLPLRDAAAANVLMVWVLQLVPDHVAFLAEARRVAAPGGRIVVVVGGRPAEPDEADEIDAILVPMQDALRPPRDRPEQVVASARRAGLDLVEQVKVTREWRNSPEEQARLVEERAFSSMWDVPDDRWEAVAVPAVAALRALPDPDRRRTRRATQEVLVLAAVPSSP